MATNSVSNTVIDSAKPVSVPSSATYPGGRPVDAVSVKAAKAGVPTAQKAVDLGNANARDVTDAARYADQSGTASKKGLGRKWEREEGTEFGEGGDGIAQADGGAPVGDQPLGLFSEGNIQLAQADAAATSTAGAESAAAGAGTGAGAGGAAAGTAGAAGAGAVAAAAGIPLGAVVAGVAAVGVAASSSSSSTSSAAASDTTAPVLQSVTISPAGNNKIVLTYNEALDGTNIPVAGAFAVTVNTVANVVTNVAVSGSEVTLTLTAAVAAGNIVSVTYTDPTAGNDANAVQDAAGNDAITATNGFTLGAVADGYVRGAQIYVDLDDDGVADSNELQAGVVTNATGGFQLPTGTDATHAIIAVGGINIDTGVPQEVPLKAPAGSTVVNPLTTLVQEIVENDNTGTTTADQATAAVVSAFGLTVGTDLTTYDAIAASDVAVQKAATQVATLVALAADSAATDASTTTTSAAAINTVIEKLALEITTAAGVVDLTDATSNGVIERLLTGAVDAANVATVVADVNTATTAIGNAASLTAISTAQAVALDGTAPAKPTAVTLGTSSDTGTTGDDKTNDSTPVVRVNFNATATDGTAAVAGNVVTVYEGTTQVGTATLVAADIAAGLVDVTLTAALAGDGSHTLTAKITDIANNVSAASADYALTLDTTVPAAPTLAEQGSTDTANGLMNDAEAATTTFRVTLPTAGSTAVAGDQVQLLGGAATKTATLTSADITAGYVDIALAKADLGSDGAKSLTAKVVDVAGNASTASAAIDFTLDTTIVTPTLALTTNSGSTADSISNSAALTTTPGTPAGDVTRSYTVDGGAASGSYTAPTAEGSHTVVVTDTDTAGNTASASITFTLDTVVPTLSATTPADNAVAVVGSSIVLTFNEAVAAGTGNIVITDTTNSVSTNISIADSTQVAISGNTVTITPTDAPDPATAYEVTVASGVLTDVAGNAFGGIASGGLNFTMADLPIVTITTGETDNLLNVGDTATVTFTLSAASTDFAVGDVTVTGGALSNFSGSGTTYTATLTPTTNSTANATVSVAANAFTSNSLGNLASSTLTLPVDTAAPAAPTVVLTTNSGSTSDSISNVGTLNVTGVETGATVQYSTDGGTTWLTTFAAVEGANSVQVRQKDTALNPSSATTFTFTLDTTIAQTTVALTTNSGSTSDSITNSAALTFNTAASDVTRTYTVDSGTASSTYTAPTAAGQHTVTVNDTDTAGNTSSASVTFTLDAAAPTLSSSTPADSATLVSPSANIVLTFNENVAAGTGNIVISDGTNSTTIAVGDTTQVTFGTDTVTINPTANLGLSTAYGVTIGSGVITDVAGNAFAGIASGGLDFTTTAAPSLSTTLGGVTDIDPRSVLVIGVTEGVKWAAGTHTITLTNEANGGGKDGFRTETTTNTQTITYTADANGTVTSSSGGTVTIDNTNNKIVINPTFDLDISNNYSLAISTGAFQGLDSGQASVAFTTVNFSTVTPGLLSGGETAAAQSQTMNATTGAMGASLRWLDVTNPADDDPSSAVYQPFDAATFDFAFVVKDMDAVENDVTVTDTFIQFNNFGANDLVYIDNQLNQANAQLWVDGNVFSGGRGTSVDPFSVTMNGTTLASSVNVVVDTAITLPTLTDTFLISVVNGNGWSNTGIMITG